MSSSMYVKRKRHLPHLYLCQRFDLLDYSPKMNKLCYCRCQPADVRILTTAVSKASKLWAHIYTVGLFCGSWLNLLFEKSIAGPGAQTGIICFTILQLLWYDSLSFDLQRNPLLEFIHGQSKQRRENEHQSAPNSMLFSKINDVTQNDIGILNSLYWFTFLGSSTSKLAPFLPIVFIDTRAISTICKKIKTVKSMFWVFFQASVKEDRPTYYLEDSNLMSN